MKDNAINILLDDAHIYASSKLLMDYEINLAAYNAAKKDIYKDNPVDAELLPFRTVRGHDEEGRDVFYKVTTINGVDYKLVRDGLST